MNNSELAAIREGHISRLEALFAGERLERAFVLQGIGGSSTISPGDDPAAWVAEALASLTAELSHDSQIFHPLFLEYWFYGVHFVDAVLGATVVPTTRGIMTMQSK